MWWGFLRCLMCRRWGPFFHLLVWNVLKPSMNYRCTKSIPLAMWYFKCLHKCSPLKLGGRFLFRRYNSCVFAGSGIPSHHLASVVFVAPVAMFEDAVRSFCLPPLKRSRKMEKSYVPWAGVEWDRLRFAQLQQTQPQQQQQRQQQHQQQQQLAHEGICLNLYTDMHHRRAVVLSDSGWILVKLVGGVRVAELRDNSIRIVQNLCCTHHSFHPTWFFRIPQICWSNPATPPVYFAECPIQGGTISVNVDFC